MYEALSMRINMRIIYTVSIKLTIFVYHLLYYLFYNVILREIFQNDAFKFLKISLLYILTNFPSYIFVEMYSIQRYKYFELFDFTDYNKKIFLL